MSANGPHPLQRHVCQRLVTFPQTSPQETPHLPQEARNCCRPLVSFDASPHLVTKLFGSDSTLFVLLCMFPQIGETQEVPAAVTCHRPSNWRMKEDVTRRKTTLPLGRSSSTVSSVSKLPEKTKNSQRHSCILTDFKVSMGSGTWLCVASNCMLQLLYSHVYCRC